MNEEWEHDFDQWFKRGKTFIIVVWALVILFFIIMIIGAIMGLVWLGHHV
jgi:hypothetical protein